MEQQGTRITVVGALLIVAAFVLVAAFIQHLMDGGGTDATNSNRDNL